MTYKEAKYWFNHNGASTSQEIEMTKLINEALEKQIPKKPITNKYFYGHYYRCPSCEMLINEGECCRNNECGQLIKWEDVK